MVNPNYDRKSNSVLDSTPNIIKVLHVDDEEDFLFLTKEFLEKMSDGEIVVESLKDPTKVVEKIKKDRIDVIVCDYLMENLNGLDLLKQIKVEDIDIPFIIFTGRGREEVVIEALNLGADYYIRKGSDARSQYTELVHQIKTAIKHKEAEEALLGSQQRLTFAIEASGAGYYEHTIPIDKSKEKSSVTERWAEIHGTTREELPSVERMWEWQRKIIHPEDLQAVQNQYDKFTSGEIDTNSIIYRIKDKAGNWRGVENISRAVERNETGEVTLVAGVCFDVTDRMKMEESLREERDLSQLYLDEAGAIIAIVNDNEEVEMINKKLTSILGYTEKDIIGKNWFDTIYEEKYRDELKFTFQQVIVGMREPTPYSEITIKTKTKEEKIIAWRNSVIYNEEGKVAKILGFGQDITDRKKIEYKLQESEEKYRSFIENFHGIAFRGTFDFQALYFHGAVEEITGYNEEDFTKKGLRWDKLIHPEDITIPLSIRDELESVDGYKSVIDYRIIRKDNKIRWIRQFVQNISSDGEKPGLVQGTLFDVTDEKKAEERVKQSENLYRTTFESTGTANLIVREDKSIALVNSKFEELTGYSKEEIVDKRKWSELLPEEEWKKLEEFQNLHFKDSKLAPDNYEIKLFDKSGTKKNIYLTVKQIPGSRDFIITMHDITSMKKIEEDLINSENLYRTIFETKGTAYAIVQQDTIVSLMNERLEEILGYTKEEVEGKMSWTFIAHPDELERLIEYSEIRAKNPSAAPSFYETKVITKDDRVRDCLVNIDIIPGTNDIVVALMDFTDYKKIQEESEETANLYKMLFESTGTSILIFDQNADISLMNSEMEKLSGYTKEEVEGKMKWVEFIPEPELSMMIEYNKKRIADPTSVPPQYETRFIDKNGIIKHILLNVNLIPSTDNFIASLMDITKSKQTLEELDKQREELSDFAQYMSHDIRNSLTAIEGYIEIIKAENENPHLEKIHRRTKYISDLLEHSIQLAEAGKTIEKKGTVKLNRLIDTVADVIIPKNIQFSRDDLIEVKGDQDRLSQVFKNLFENAVIHGEPEEISVRQTESENEIVISVINDGKSIEHDVMDKIFDRGFTTLKEGRGIGLTIVKKLIEAHDWRIRLSTENNKTVFKIIIPI